MCVNKHTQVKLFSINKTKAWRHMFVTRKVSGKVNMFAKRDVPEQGEHLQRPNIDPCQKNYL